MNLKEAREILGVDRYSSLDKVRRQYKLKALKYHPDKNKSPNAVDEFRKVNEAYVFLTSVSENKGDYKPETYSDLLFSFLKKGMDFSNGEDFTEDDLAKQQILHEKIIFVLSCILKLCEEKAISYVSKLDETLLKNVVTLMQKYKEPFHFTDDFISKIENILLKKQETKKTDDVQYIILNPYLEDLFQHNVYRFMSNNKTFIVPLWHSEVIFENENGEDIIVQCCPVLEENIEINEENDIIIHLDLPIKDALLSSPCQLNKYVGLQNIQPIYFNTSELKVTREKQTIVLSEMGIPKVNPDNVLDVESRSNIILNIYLVE